MKKICIVVIAIVFVIAVITGLGGCSVDIQFGNKKEISTTEVVSDDPAQLTTQVTGGQIGTAADGYEVTPNSTAATESAVSTESTVSTENANVPVDAGTLGTHKQWDLLGEETLQGVTIDFMNEYYFYGPIESSNDGGYLLYHKEPSGTTEVNEALQVIARTNANSNGATNEEVISAQEDLLLQEKGQWTSKSTLDINGREWQYYLFSDVPVETETGTYYVDYDVYFLIDGSNYAYVQSSDGAHPDTYSFDVMSVVNSMKFE